MASQKFTVDQSMQVAWDYFGRTFWPFFGMVALAGFICFLPDMANMGVNWSRGNGSLYGLLLGIGGAILKGLMNLGLINIQLRILKDQEFSSNDLWGAAKSFWSYVAATILVSILCTVGTCFLIVPGIILGLVFMFYPYLIVDKGLGPIQAMRASIAITQGSLWELFFLIVLTIIIKGLGYLCFVVGAAPAHMFGELAITQAYKSLLRNTPIAELAFLPPDKLARFDEAATPSAFGTKPQSIASGSDMNTAPPPEADAGARIKIDESIKDKSSGSEHDRMS